MHWQRGGASPRTSTGLFFDKWGHNNNVQGYVYHIIMTSNEKAFKDAEKELADEKVREIKGVMKSILQKIQNYQDKKADAEEAIRLLKLDLEDLRAGKIDKIKDRHAESKRADLYFPLPSLFIDTMPLSINNSNAWTITNTGSTATTGGAYGTGSITAMGTSALDWNRATSGTYVVQCSNGTVREMFL